VIDNRSPFFVSRHYEIFRLHLIFNQKMIRNCLFYFLTALLICANCGFVQKSNELHFFSADNGLIQYVGRIDFSNKVRPRIWAPGVYIIARFNGSQCEVLMNDEVSGENNYNYLEIVVDNKPTRIKLTGKTNVIKVAEGLADTEHSLLICKDTESNIGFIDLIGLKCEQLLPSPTQPERKIEYYGDSITSGTGMDLSVLPCDKGQWYDQHNAYMSYGARTSRNLHAQWHLTALAGVGLVHSCCQMNVVMPQIYDKVFLRGDTIKWDFTQYQPDVLTICLGQNDGKQDSVLFCTNYVKLLDNLRANNPKSTIICLTSPMADSSLTVILKKYLTGIVNQVCSTGDKNIYKYFFSKQYHNGCGGHPDLDEHQLIADELTAYIKQVKGW